MTLTTLTPSPIGDLGMRTVDLTKRITPVLTHDGLTIARFSNRATAVRRAREWGGCVIGPTHTDPGRIANGQPAPVAHLYADRPAFPGYVADDMPSREFETARFRLGIPRDAMVWVSIWEREVPGVGRVWQGYSRRWYALAPDAAVAIGTEYPSATAAFRALLSR